MKCPLFVLLGDRFLCEEKRKEILANLQKEFSAPLALTILRADEIILKDLFSQARTLPFLAPAQVFCIRDVDQFTKDEITLWGEYFKSASPRTFFIFEVESLDRNHPFLEGAGKTRQVFSLASEGEKFANRFIQEKLKQAGKRMTAEARKLLEERVGETYLFLDSLLEQLIAYSGEKPEIDRAMVEALEEKLESLEGEDLLQALAERNFTKALAVLNDLLELNFRDFPAVIGLLHWQFRRLWEAKRYQSEGLSEREISFRLRVSPNRAAGFFKELSRFSREELEKILEGLFQLDWQLKTGRAEGRYEIERWLATAISPATR